MEPVYSYGVISYVTIDDASLEFNQYTSRYGYLKTVQGDFKVLIECKYLLVNLFCKSLHKLRKIFIDFYIKLCGSKGRHIILQCFASRSYELFLISCHNSYEFSLFEHRKKRKPTIQNFLAENLMLNPIVQLSAKISHFLQSLHCCSIHFESFS